MKTDHKFYMNTEEEINNILYFLKKEFKERKKRTAVIGLSGGLDSTVCARLCMMAGLKVHGVVLPYYGSGLKESNLVLKYLQIEGKETKIDIGHIVDPIISTLEFSGIELDCVDKGNIQARTRMIVQYAIARRLNGLVVGTEDLSEYYLGYFTLHGDAASDISPIRGFFKTQVFEIGKFLGIPKSILEAPPSPRLWKGQTAEKELGFSYKIADSILDLYGHSHSENMIIKKGYKKEIVAKVLKRMSDTEFKRNGCPYCFYTRSW